jgi:hypothetical protein
MPSLGGAVAAMLVGILVDDSLQPLLGTGVTLFVSFVVSTVAFYYVRNWLKRLRDG